MIPVLRYFKIATVHLMEREFQFFSETASLEDEERLEPGIERVLRVRLDKWLWAARFFKTRAIARVAVEKGNVFYNNERSKASREIEIGALLKIRQGRFEKTVIIKALSTRRRSTDEAFSLFEETKDSRLAREENPAQHSASPPFSSTVGNKIPHQEPSRERRGIRFLRRSFVRGEANTNRHSLSPKLENNEFEIFE